MKKLEFDITDRNLEDQDSAIVRATQSTRAALETNWKPIPLSHIREEIEKTELEIFQINQKIWEK